MRTIIRRRRSIAEDVELIVEMLDEAYESMVRMNGLSAAWPELIQLGGLVCVRSDSRAAIAITQDY